MWVKFMPQIEARKVGTAMIAAQAEIERTTSFCFTPSSARFASRIEVRSSRCALTCSSIRRAWSATSRK